VTEQATTVAELLSDPARWTQGYYARDAKGALVGPASQRAVCWCLLGAIVRVYGRRGHSSCLVASLREALNLPPDVTLTNWNDAPARTHAEVLDLCRRAGV
jgi:hypothetical protein